MLFVTVVYNIKNNIDGKQYIGSSINIKRRFLYHQKYLRRKEHFNHYLQNAWNKYGEENFEFKVLLYCDKKNLLFYEQRAIDVYVAFGSGGYNLRPKAENQLGFKFSEESRKRMSDFQKGKVISKEHREKISKALRGRTVPKETREKISNAHKGVPLSAAHKEALKPSRRGCMLGKKHSEATKLKMSKLAKGRIIPDETRKKMSEAHEGHIAWNKGKPFSEEIRRKMLGPVSIEHRQRISAANMGRKDSEITRQRKSIAAKKGWIKRRTSV